MTDAIWDVRELLPVEWRLLRRLRLDALDDSPKAFFSHLHDEKSWGEADWRGTFVSSKWMIARAEEVVGLLRLVHDPTEPQSRYVESIWVVPTQRKRGVFRAMLREAAELARKAGVRDLVLWVLEDNHDAQQVYERLGFVETGERQPLPDETGRPEEAGRYERRMGLAVAELLSV
jgi:ribosomal protein S18 acetylase RimI-like enzyme